MKNSKSVVVSDFSQYIASGLKRFRNIEYAFSKISEEQQISNRHAANVRKQATQLTYCLGLAMEYFEASKSVTLATRPVLLYYAAMNMALAEVLMKQDGRSSLDSSRQKHAHHGLEVAFNYAAFKKSTVKEQLSKLAVRPHKRKGFRSGTFELWHRTAREYPVMGMTIDRSSSVSRFSQILSGDSGRLPFIPAGFSLLDATLLMPTLASRIEQYDLESDYNRGSISSEIGINRSSSFKFVLHPCSKSRCQRVQSTLKFSPRTVQNVHFTKFKSGFLLTVNSTEKEKISFKFPPLSTISKEDVRICCRYPELNEFGAYYVALYILGNLSRYFPEIWLKEVDLYSPLAAIGEAICDEFERRAPHLLLSELEGSLLMPTSN